MHADAFDAMTSPEYDPGAQNTGDEEMLGQYWPATHGMHVSAVGWFTASE
jgi:hypothetical protein